MSNAFNLDNFRTATIKRYAPTEIELSDGSAVELKSLLKLGEKARKQILKAVQDINDIEGVDDEDDELVELWAGEVCDAVGKILKLITDSPRKLLSELDHEDPQIKANLHTAVLTEWIGNSQLGEAESSPS